MSVGDHRIVPHGATLEFDRTGVSVRHPKFRTWRIALPPGGRLVLHPIGTSGCRLEVVS